MRQIYWGRLAASAAAFLVALLLGLGLGEPLAEDRSQKRIVLLSGDRDTTPMVYHSLTEHVDVVQVIIEKAVSRQKIFRWRVKRFGLPNAIGQVLFSLLVQPLLVIEARDRRREIVVQEGLKEHVIPENVCIHVSSINDDDVIAELVRLGPVYVVVHGTRIIARKVLNATEAPFINIHAGITPRYRGAHGAYWALAENDRAHCGVTVHLVDEGIDTGRVLAQGIIDPTARDNFTTYPLLQLSQGLQSLGKILKQGGLTSVDTPPPEPSNIWAHPTIWGYFWQRLSKGVR